MKLYQRHLLRQLEQTLSNNKSVLLLGPRQVGKSTLIRDTLSKKYSFDTILLQDPQQRIKYEKDPSQLIREYELSNSSNLIYVDEIQKVPSLFDSIQYLIDEHKKQFILTGSSARKLRRSHSNLLPGRLILHKLDPLMWGELGLSKKSYIPEIGLKNFQGLDGQTPNDLMVYGSLPEIISISSDLKKPLLRSYSTVYLEEEIRAEALSRNIGIFSSFLQLAASESGSCPNFTNISNQTGISLITVKEYYQILFDTLIIHKLPPFIKKSRRRISKSSKYYFFDIGVRNAIADFPIEDNLSNIDKGLLFEHFIVLEIFRRQNLTNDFNLYYWRTQSGLEVDLIIEKDKAFIPIEIKSGSNIKLKNLSGLIAFMEEYEIKKGYVVSMDEKPYRLDDRITVIPWNYL